MAQKSRLQSTSRTATWRILSPYSGMTSEEFVIGKWTWHLKVEETSQFSVYVYPKSKNSASDYIPSPTASLCIQVSCSEGEPKTDVYNSGVFKIKLKYGNGCVWKLESSLFHKAPITVRVEFIDLKMPLEDGSDDKLYSIWDEESVEKKSSNKMALASVGRMLSEKIQMDIVINTSNGSIEAHRAILAANSSVFQTMFSNSRKEKASSTINIPDMTLQTCEAMLSFIYGKTEDEEFRAHRMELVTAADKYNMVELKEACELSLVEDIGPENVLDRLQCAFKYELHELKSRCLRYLVNFGMIHEIRSEMNTFFQNGDRELIAEVVSALLVSHKTTLTQVEFTQIEAASNLSRGHYGLGQTPVSNSYPGPSVFGSTASSSSSVVNPFQFSGQLHQPGAQNPNSFEPSGSLDSRLRWRW